MFFRVVRNGKNLLSSTQKSEDTLSNMKYNFLVFRHVCGAEENSSDEDEKKI